MNIIYYSWDEMIKNDAMNSLKDIGHNVIEHKAKFIKYDFDEYTISSLKRTIEKNKADIIFSFNFFPDVSRVAKEKEIIYISWVYDNPHLTLESKTLVNDVNRIFVFDSSLVDKYGRNNVFYSPLPAKIIELGNGCFKYDVTFVGTMYDGEKDIYSQIKYLPEKLRGELDGIIYAQFLVKEGDILSEPMEFLSDEIQKYVKIPLSDEYRECSIDIFKNMMLKHITMHDRINAMKKLGERFDTYLFCEKKHNNLPVNNMGFVSNNNLPTVISQSKINLNITLRTIKKGIPLRVMHILGAGGFCLTDHKEDMDEYFEDGVNIAWFYSEDEMVDKCYFYLKNEEARNQIAYKGRKTAKERLNYNKLFNDVFEKALR